MTEDEWLGYSRPMPLFNHLEAEAARLAGLATGQSTLGSRVIGWIRRQLRSNEYWSPARLHRRLYLLACAADRVLWSAMWGDDPFPPRLLTEERFAEGELTLDELLADDPDRQWWWPNPWHLVSNIFRRGAWRPEFEPINAAYADLTRDIFGNPFRPAPALNAAWLTSDVNALAEGMYESRDFSAMPILADALQDAGCENGDILSHCRNEQPHARGCWVVDLVLGKQ